MERDWEHGPEESYPERERRIDILLEELHMSIKDGEPVTFDEIADYVGCEKNALFEIQESALKKLRQACNPDDRLLHLKGFRHLIQRADGMAAIVELLNQKQNPY